MNDQQLPPPTPEDLIAQMRESYEDFLSACQKVSAEQALRGGVCGEWSTKAVVDHLTGWQVESLSILEELLETHAGDIDYDIDDFNKTAVGDRADLSWGESLAAFNLSFKAYDEALVKIPVAQYRTNDGLKSWVKAMTHEYQFHLSHVYEAQKL